MIKWKGYSSNKPIYPCNILATEPSGCFDHYSAPGDEEFWSLNSCNLNNNIFDSRYTHWSYFKAEDCKKTWNSFKDAMPDEDKKILAFGDEEKSVELYIPKKNDRFYIPGFMHYLELERFLKFNQYWIYYEAPKK